MYSELISSKNPGLLIIMIDQSTSMGDPYTGKENKAQAAALAVNRVTTEIISSCVSGEGFKDRCHVGIIGYSSGAKVITLKNISELVKISKTITLKKKVPDQAGGLTEVDDILRIFVDPVASNGTAMDEGFQEACKGVSNFVQNNQSSFPPVVINITDGEPNEWHEHKTFIKTTAAAKEITKLSTNDGTALVFNVHISKDAEMQLVFPSNNDNFKNDPFANFLFDISSEIPQQLVDIAINTGFDIKPGARGFIYNASAENLIKILKFGSGQMVR